MPEHVRTKLLTPLWGLVGFVLVGLGCQAQVSYSILTGSAPTTKTITLGGPADKPADKPAEGAVPREFLQPAAPVVDKHAEAMPAPEIKQAAYEIAATAPEPARSGEPKRVSVMPEFRAAAGAAADTSANRQPPAAETYDLHPPETYDLQPGTPAAGAPPTEIPAGHWEGPAEGPQADAGVPAGDVPELTQAGGPRLPELPEFKREPVQTAANTPHPGAEAVVLPSETPVQPAAPPGACPAAVPPGAPGAGPLEPGETPLPVLPPPTEKVKVSHPPYMIEPPDILLLDAIRLIPRPPYVVQPLDVLLVRVTGTPANQPIDGTFVVAPDGTVNLGFSYGVARVAGMTLEQVQESIRKQLARTLTSPQVSVGLAQFRGMQQLRGEHLVRQDGTISLGTYGCVYVTGMTIAQAKCAIEKHLSQFLVDPEVSLDVFAYNSKVYYVITDGAGYGEQVFRLPITGNETVLDAIANIQGLPVVASKRRIWVARPGPCHNGCVQVLPVDWRAITEGGSTCTNYQLFPGDRVYVKADCLIHLDNTIAKIVTPIERLFGVTLLGSTTVNSFRHNFNNNGTGSGAVIVP